MNKPIEPDHQAVRHRRWIGRVILRIIIVIGMWCALLFWSAGRLDWTRAWMCVGLWSVTMAANLLILLRVNPDVVVHRLKRTAFTEPFDRLLIALILLTASAFPLVAGLDAVRFQWSALPVWTIGLGAIMHALGDATIVWAMAVNPFLEGPVRIQSERGHRVVTTGPYRFVRHPMYLGLFMVLLACPLILGAAWAFVPAGILIGLFIIRTDFEDRLLRAKLPGYEQYSRQTRRRLFPGLW